MKLQLNKLQSYLNRHQGTLLTAACVGLFSAMALESTDLLAAKTGEMADATTYLEGLIRGNAARAIMGIGCLGGVVYSLMKSAWGPFGISVGCGVGYGFANKWIDSAYAYVC